MPATTSPLKLAPEDMEPLFAALRKNNPADTASLGDAIEAVINTAKAKKISLEEFKQTLVGYGIDLTENFKNWISNKY